VQATAIEGRLAIADLRARRVWFSDEEDQALAVQATWAALGGLEEDLAWRLTLYGPEETPAAGPVEMPLSPRYPTSRWPQGMIVGERALLPLDPASPEGTYTLRVEILGKGNVVAGEARFPVPLPPRGEPYVPALREMGVSSGVSYGGEMRLLGYAARQEGKHLALDLTWLALRAMGSQYKIFVHLLDGEGAILTQHDAMPRDWSYPTTFWDRGEVFVEHVRLDLNGIPPGAYRLAVGVYEPGQDRLPAFSPNGAALPGGQAIVELQVEDP
jgi:hypothetical protein